MKTATVYGCRSKEDVVKKCHEEKGFHPAAVRKVDSGGKGNAWKCFESLDEALTWDKQK